MGSSPSKEGAEKGGFLDGYALCGSTKDTLDSPPAKTITTLLQKADAMCISSPTNEEPEEPPPPLNPTSALLARALVSEVTDNPNTMTPAAMAERERLLLKAQERARVSQNGSSKPVGTMGHPNLVASLAHAIKGDDRIPTSPNTSQSASVVPPNSMIENRAQVNTPERLKKQSANKHSVTIGLSLSRRNAAVGHPDTVTRQTAFDFNELQDRQYKYVSSTDASGWMAGGGERGGTSISSTEAGGMVSQTNVTSMLTSQGQHKLAAPDTVHIPIIQIDAESPAAVNAIVTALARGEVFIPHMSILPEALSVNGISPPDLVVRFGCERNDDVPPEEWPNWCLEFMHNQLYEYFKDQGAQWSPRPFQITLARKVRWKTVKHMNRYFAHAERVIDAWREKGPQYLDPQLSYIEGGATPEEVARPHGIYLLRNGVPTNYFAPNFDPPYTTKMTRSLLQNVLSKSWDKKRREWTSLPVPRLVTPTMLMASMCGCTDPNQGGFVASEVTSSNVAAGTPKRVTAIPSRHEARDDPEDEQYTQLVDVSMSNKSGASTKVSSVNLTPYDDEDGMSRPPSSKPDPVAQLETTLEDDLSLEEEDLMSDDDFLDDDNVEDMLGDGLGHKGIEETSSENARSGRYGSSPIPENCSGLRSLTPPVGRAPTPEPVRMRNNSPPETPANDANMLSPGTLAPSEATTVEHMNSTSEKLMRREVERKKLREANNTSLALHEEEIEETSSHSENTTPKSIVSSTSKKKKRIKNKVQDAYEKERARQIAMIAMAQQETLKETQSPRTGSPLSQKNGNYTPAKYNMEPSPSPKHGGVSAGMERNDSGSVSLEYSIDSSMMGETSTLAGQFVGGDASVSTAGASRRRTKLPSLDEDESATSSLMTEVVPCDEELFAVGWAKALDPKSGSYYYFTLDRSKIVWENPLSTGDGHTQPLYTA